MIDPKCNRCGDELEEFGAILLSPPDEDGKVRKDHLCVDCYNSICTGIGWCRMVVEEDKNHSAEELARMDEFERWRGNV